MIRQRHLSADGRFELVRGDCLTALASLPSGIAEAVVTDPPYSSGGLYRGDRAAQSVAAKYVQTGSERFADATFCGETMDQRSWVGWCRDWLEVSRRVVRPGGYLLTFIDWRQLPALTDAVQQAGWVWRGIISWDKGPSARAACPHYFRHQCEFVVWATNGPCPQPENWPPPGEGCYPGSYSHPVKQADKHHPTGKPTPLLRDLLRCVPPDGLVIDPFMGSGTTGVAAVESGKRFIGIEKDEQHWATAKARLAQTEPSYQDIKRPDLFSDPAAGCAMSAAEE